MRLRTDFYTNVRDEDPWISLARKIRQFLHEVEAISNLLPCTNARERFALPQFTRTATFRHVDFALVCSELLDERFYVSLEAGTRADEKNYWLPFRSACDCVQKAGADRPAFPGRGQVLYSCDTRNPS